MGTLCRAPVPVRVCQNVSAILSNNISGGSKWVRKRTEDLYKGILSSGKVPPLNRLKKQKMARLEVFHIRKTYRPRLCFCSYIVTNFPAV